MATLKLHAILLAAGSSTRMGQPKPLLAWHGRPLVTHLAATALAARLEGLVVVLGAAAPAVRAALGALPQDRLSLVECADYQAGQAASLRCGLAALPTATAGVLVLLVDQPLVSVALLDRLVEAFVQAPTALAVVPRYQGQRGNPVLLAAGLFSQLARLSGDVGARSLLQAHAEQIHWLDLDDPAVIYDIDTPADYRRATELSTH